MKRRILALAVLSAVSWGCQNPVSDENSQSRAIVELANGTVFNFTLPPNGASKILAQRIPAAGNSEATAITVTGLTAAAVPYDSFVLDLVPAQITSDGTVVPASATLKVVTYSASTATVPVDSNFKPKARVFSITPTNGLTNSTYVIPTGKGVFQFHWATMEPILPIEALTDYIYKSYTLRSVEVVAKTSN